MDAHHKRLCSFGPGGIKCSCCRPGTKRNARVMANRKVRRVSKQEVRAIIGAAGRDV